MTEALKAGTIDYARNPTADQWDSLQGLPDIVAHRVVDGVRGERLHASSASTPTASPSRAAAPRRRRSRTRPSATRSATPSTSRPSSIACWSGHGRRRHDAASRRPWQRQVAHSSRPNVRVFDIEVAKQKLEAAGYKLDANGKRLDKDNKPIDLRMVVPDSSSTLRAERRVHHRLVERARHRHDDPGLRRRHADRPDAAARGRRARPTSTSSSGTGAATSIPTRCSTS